MLNLKIYGLKQASDTGVLMLCVAGAAFSSCKTRIRMNILIDRARRPKGWCVPRTTRCGDPCMLCMSCRSSCWTAYWRDWILAGKWIDIMSMPDGPPASPHGSGARRSRVCRASLSLAALYVLLLPLTVGNKGWRSSGAVTTQSVALVSGDPLRSGVDVGLLQV